MRRYLSLKINAAANCFFGLFGLMVTFDLDGFLPNGIYKRPKFTKEQLDLLRQAK